MTAGTTKPPGGLINCHSSLPPSCNEPHANDRPHCMGRNRRQTRRGGTEEEKERLFLGTALGTWRMRRKKKANGAKWGDFDEARGGKKDGDGEWA